MYSKSKRMLSVKMPCFVFNKCMHSNSENICASMTILFITASIVKKKNKKVL